MAKQTNYQKKNLISDFGKSMLIKGHVLLFFCSLPKSNNPFDHIPLLQPICSEWYVFMYLSFLRIFDSFLKIASQKVFLYVIDTAGFINKISSRNFDYSKTYLAAMGAFLTRILIKNRESNEFMDKRTSQETSSYPVRDLILLVVKCM